MEMTAVWKERKSKSPFPLFPHCLGKLAKNRELPTFPQLRRRLGISFFLPARLTSISTKALPTCPLPFVTNMPVRSGLAEDWALAPASSGNTVKFELHPWRMNTFEIL